MVLSGLSNAHIHGSRLHVCVLCMWGILGVTGIEGFRDPALVITNIEGYEFGVEDIKLEKKRSMREVTVRAKEPPLTGRIPVHEPLGS